MLGPFPSPPSSSAALPNPSLQTPPPHETLSLQPFPTPLRHLSKLGLSLFLSFIIAAIVLMTGCESTACPMQDSGCKIAMLWTHHSSLHASSQTQASNSR